MKIKSEVKVGLIGIATLVILIWGINYLKGRDILNSSYALHAFFENSEGLESSAPVLMNGMKIGYIDAIELQAGIPLPIHAVLHIDKSVSLKRGSKAVIFSADLLGSKSIRMEPSSENRLLEHNDTILAISEPDMFSALTDQIVPVIAKIGALASSLDSVVIKIDKLLETDDTGEVLSNLSSVSTSLSASLEPGGSLYESFHNLESFSSMLASQENEIASMTTHLNSVSASLDSAGIDQLAEELKKTSAEFTIMMEQLNSGQGSAGKLIYSDSLYMQLFHLLSDLDSLVIDLNENPQDYVRFSLFGK